SHYLVWFEIGRTELLRDLGIPYAELEARKIFMPVIEVGARYVLPVRYDEEIDVLTHLEEVTGVRVRFGYRLLRCPNGEAVGNRLRVQGGVERGGTPRRLPEELQERLRDHMAVEKETP